MLLDVVRALESAGITARVRSRSKESLDARLHIELGEATAEFEVEERAQRPFPADLARLRMRSNQPPRLRVLVAPFIGRRTGEALIDADWSWADQAGNFDIRAPGIRLRQRLMSERPPVKPRLLPGGPRTTRIIRWLLLEAPAGVPILASTVAAVGGVSRPRVSQLLQNLEQQGLVARVRRQYVVEAITPLLDAFLRDYRGPGGSQLPAYTLDAPNHFAEKATTILNRSAEQPVFAISADVGPDLVSSWRAPTHTVLYVRDSVSLGALGLVETKGNDDANVLLRMPSDQSLFSTVVHQASGKSMIPLVDAPQMMWDLLHLGGDDREEAAGRLREWFLQHRKAS